MSPSSAFFIGVFAGIMIVSITAWWAVTWFRDAPERGLGAIAVLIRVLGERTGFKSALVAVGSDVVIVPFEQMARAIEKGSLLGYVPVRVTRSEGPPPLPYQGSTPEDPPDGHA